MFASYRNKSIESHNKTIDRFLYDETIVLIWFDLNEFKSQGHHLLLTLLQI